MLIAPTSLLRGVPARVAMLSPLLWLVRVSQSGSLSPFSRLAVTLWLSWLSRSVIKVFGMSRVNAASSAVAVSARASLNVGASLLPLILT